MPALGQELNSIKTGTKSATLSIPENYGSPVIRDMLMLSAKFSASIVIQFSREEAQTRSRPTNRLRMSFGNHTASTSAKPWKLPVDAHGMKKSYKAVQSVRPWAEEMKKSALSQLESNKKFCRLMTRVSVALPGVNSDFNSSVGFLCHSRWQQIFQAAFSILSALPTPRSQHCWVADLRPQTSLRCLLDIFFTVVSCQKLHLVSEKLRLVSECSCSFRRHDENPTPAYKTITQNFMWKWH